MNKLTRRHVVAGLAALPLAPPFDAALGPTMLHIGRRGAPGMIGATGNTGPTGVVIGELCDYPGCSCGGTLPKINWTRIKGTATPKGMPTRAQESTMDADTIQTLLDLLNPLHERLNEATYDERFADNFNSPSSREFTVTITAAHERDLGNAVVLLEERLRRAQPAEATGLADASDR